MIITEQKNLSEVLENVKAAESVFIIGCNSCAATCKTGGEKEVEKMSETLRKEGKTVTGGVVLDPACSLLQIKKMYRQMAEEITASDAILSMSCGGGAQAITEIVKDKQIHPVNNTLFQGEITELSPKRAYFVQKCSLCGECMLSRTGAICPVTRCSKSLVNGPCGGVKNGKCEVDSDMDCAWMLIYRTLSESGRLDEMKKIKRAKDHSKNRKPSRLVVA